MDMLIGGKRVSGGRIIEIVDPARNEVIDTVPFASEEELELALASSQEGYRE